MKNLFGIIYIGIGFLLILLFAGCAARQIDSSGSPEITESAAAPAISPSSGSSNPSKPAAISPPGDYIPKYALEEAERSKKEFLAENAQSASDLKYRFFYNNKGEACLEYTVIPKGGYTWPKPTWIGYTWGNSRGGIGGGDISYTVTKKKSDEAEYRMAERRRDPVFREIEQVVLQIATEYDYDYYSAYGISVKYRDPKVKKGVCEGYASAVVNAFANHPLVQAVETWSGGNHAWNVLVLKDGYKLYCDATWYDGNNIDNEGYVVHIPDRNPVDLTFDIEEFNSLGGAIDNATGKLLAVHFAWGDAKIVK